MSIQNIVERPKSLTAIATDNIRRAIVDGNLSFGSQLSESTLALQMGISKTPVREALLQLKLEGLVDIQPQSGTYVFQPSETEVQEICRFREIIELSALELAMRIDSPGLARKMTAALRITQESSDDKARAHSRDAEFHGAIIASSANEYLRQAYLLVSHKIEALRARLNDEDDHVDSCNDTHSTIMTLVRDGDIGGACAELRAHIRSTENAYMRASRAHAGEPDASGRLPKIE